MRSEGEDTGVIPQKTRGLKSNSVWTIAGHDPYSGAGIAADLRVGSALDVPMRSIIATFTAQNDARVKAVQATPQEWLDLQWDSLRELESPAAIKIGLLHSVAQITQLTELLEQVNCPIILDPVLGASSGPALTEKGIEEALRKFLPKITLLTPNRLEAEQLLGIKIQGEDDFQRAAKMFLDLGVPSVLMKGGHPYGPDVHRPFLQDYFDDGRRAFSLIATRRGGSFRGTGCTLSSAIACSIAQGFSLRESVVRAHAYVQSAIRISSGHLKSCSMQDQIADLHYTASVHYPTFARIDDGPLGFYVVVPNLDWVRRLVPSGIRTLQIRIKDKSDVETENDIREAIAICRAHNIRLFINDAWQLAIKLKAYGVHLGQEDLDSLSPTDIKSLQAAGLRLGISTHSLEELARAKALQPSYIALGPIRPTTCKSMAFGPQGFDRIGEWKARLPSHIPIVAIGGLKSEHAEACLAQGADSIAVISDVTEAANPEERVAEWLAKFATLNFKNS